MDSLAGKSRGALFRVTSGVEIAFDRLTSEMSGHYLLGVICERLGVPPADRALCVTLITRVEDLGIDHDKVHVQFENGLGRAGGLSLAERAP